ncbi:MAG: sensor histidine kinase, partial [Kiritimatiellia bacterium]|nr:sensor histidine kinase [Kiritimatiellia bacterium]
LTLWEPEGTTGLPASRIWESDVQLAGTARKIRIESRIPPLSPDAAGAFWLPAAALAIGLLTASLLLTLAGRAGRVERLVEERTVDLRETAQRLRAEMAERERWEVAAEEAGRKERERLGIELHDSIGQKLSAAAMLSRALSRRLPADASEEVGMLADLVKECAAESRRIAHGLAPIGLPGGSLQEALRRLADETCAATGKPCELESRGEADADPALAAQFFRIAQEAVNNAARHARAETLRLRLDAQKGTIRLRIEDDGIGLPENPDASGGMGLRLMKRRAASIGAALSIHNLPGRGVCVDCLWPAPESVNAETTESGIPSPTPSSVPV